MAAGSQGSVGVDDINCLVVKREGPWWSGLARTGVDESMTVGEANVGLSGAAADRVRVARDAAWNVATTARDRFVHVLRHQMSL